MKRIVQTALMAMAVSFMLPTVTGFAGANCDAGPASNGKCADESMVTTARRSAMVFSQPRLSRTAHPVLPSADRLYRYPNQLIPDQQPTTFFFPPVNGGGE